MLRAAAPAPRHVGQEMTVPIDIVAPWRMSRSLTSTLLPCGEPSTRALTRRARNTRQREVLYAAWDPAGDALRGLVRGHETKVYHAAAFFSLTRGQPAEFELGECGGPVGLTAST
jgi:hypothetical protein